MSATCNIATASSISMHICDECGKSLKRTWDLKRHKKIHTGERPFICDVCQKRFIQNSDLKNHLKTHACPSEDLKCRLCQKTFARKENLKHHLERKVCFFKMPNDDKQDQPLPKRHKKNKKSILDVFCVKEILPSDQTCLDLKMFLNDTVPVQNKLMKEQLRDKKALKWYLSIAVQMCRVGNEGEQDRITTYFRSHVLTDLAEDFLEAHIHDAHAKILILFEEFIRRESGWVMEKINKLEIFIGQYSPLESK